MARSSCLDPLDRILIGTLSVLLAANPLDGVLVGSLSVVFAANPLDGLLVGAFSVLFATNPLDGVLVGSLSVFFAANPLDRVLVSTLSVLLTARDSLVNACRGQSRDSSRVGHESNGVGELHLDEICSKTDNNARRYWAREEMKMRMRISQEKHTE